MFVSREIVDIVLMTLKENSSKLTSALLSSGIFHPITVDSSIQGNYDGSYQKISFELHSKVNKIVEYLKEFGEFSPNVTGTLKVDNWADFSREIIKEISSLESKIDPLISKIKETKQQAEKLSDTLRKLEPLCQLDIELQKLSELRLFSIKVGELPIDQAEKARKAFSESYIFLEQLDEKRLLAVVATKKEDEKNTERILFSIGFKDLELPEGLPGNPSVACEEIRKRLESLGDMIENSRAELGKYKNIVVELYAKASTAYEAIKVLSMSKFTDYFIITRGFVPMNEIKKLEKILKKALKDDVLVFSNRVERGFNVSEVPSSINVPKPLRPFKMLVDNYGAPKMNEIYPVLMVAITFPIIFALMFPDAGHGLLVMLFGYFMLKNAKGREGWKNTGLLALYLGGASIITGILAGEFFGPLTKISEILWHGHPVLPSPFEGGSSAVYIMINLSLKLGASLLILGTFLGLLNNIISRDLIHAATIGLPKFLAFTFALYPFILYNASEAGGIIYGAIFGGSSTIQNLLVKWGASMSLILIFIGEPILHLIKHKEESSISSAIILSFMEMFDTILMMIGNTASFLRILGLSVAHAGLMYSFTVLAELLMGGVLGSAMGIVVYALGNLLAAGLEGIIVFAHSLRLHYYEWFSKFYSGTGIPFSPIKTALNILLD